MKIRVFAAGIAAVLITGGAATVAQRVITQKTRGVLPVTSDKAHTDSRSVVLAMPAPGHLSPPTPEPAIDLPGDPPITTVIADAPPPPTSVTISEPVTAVFEPQPAVIPDPGPLIVTQAPEPVASDPAVSRATDPSAATGDGTKADPVETVESFLERNRKEAEAAIHSLSTEAANLKSRLAKVETALIRWQSFAHALSTDQPGAQPVQPQPSKALWKRPEPESSAPLTRPAQTDPKVPPAEGGSPPNPVTEVPTLPSVPAPSTGEPLPPTNEPRPIDPSPAPPENPTIPQR